MQTNPPTALVLMLTRYWRRPLGEVKTRDAKSMKEAPDGQDSLEISCFGSGNTDTGPCNFFEGRHRDMRRWHHNPAFHRCHEFQLLLSDRGGVLLWLG